MFNADFFPTPSSVIDQMMEGENVSGKVILEPSAGKGDIVDRLYQAGAKEVLSCEKDPDLRKIAQTKSRLIGEDCLQLTADQISHVDYIVMNPPFSDAAGHILHLYKIAPAGCKIIALANSETVTNTYTARRKELLTLIERQGFWQDLGEAFSGAQRKTDVGVALIKMNKEGANYSQEFDGFFMEEDAAQQQADGLMGYNAIRDLVNRYVESIKIFDLQLETAVRLHEMSSEIFEFKMENSKDYHISVRISKGDVPVTRGQFKKDMQKAGWNWVFSKMNMKKYATSGLKEDINKFVEKQENIPFTMTNIYKMLEIVVGTAGQRMDKAILEVFDKFTAHHHENRHGIEGWQTNSHYLLNKRFIVNRSDDFDDLLKALCYISGTNYDDLIDWRQFSGYMYKLKDRDGRYVRKYTDSDYKIAAHYYEHNAILREQEARPGSTIEVHDWPQLWGKWTTWNFFKVKRHLKGSIHLEFLDEKVWAAFNERVAKLKGYPLPEKKEQTKWQQQRQDKADGVKVKPVVLSTIRL